MKDYIEFNSLIFDMMGYGKSMITEGRPDWNYIMPVFDLIKRIGFFYFIENGIVKIMDNKTFIIESFGNKEAIDNAIDALEQYFKRTIT